MKKVAFIAIAVAAAAGIAVGIAFASGAVGGKTTADREPKDPAVQFGRPVLLPVSMKPLRVKGRGFKHGESVKLSASSATAKVRASDAGTFVATLKGVGACDAGTIVARGDRGSRTSINISSVVCETSQ